MRSFLVGQLVATMALYGSRRLLLLVPPVTAKVTPPILRPETYISPINRWRRIMTTEVVIINVNMFSV
jgi:hypothetical protein